MKVDLHIHTTFSDGTLKPLQVINYANEKNISVISITDHNSIEGLISLSELNSYNVKIIPGIEFSTEYYTQLHILGYGINLKSKELDDVLKVLKNSYARANVKLLQKLRKKGIKLEGQINKGGTIIRRNMAKSLVEAGYCTTIKEAYAIFLNYEKQDIASPLKLTPEKAIWTIKQAGGIPVLAHPGKLEKEGADVMAVIDELMKYGLLGIECYNSSHNEGQQTRYIEKAYEKGLIISGGSDFHGTNKPDVEMGICTNSQFIDSDWLTIFDFLT